MLSPVERRLAQLLVERAVIVAIVEVPLSRAVPWGALVPALTSTVSTLEARIAALVGGLSLSRGRVCFFSSSLLYSRGH